jgi:site-specific DNA recombinase
MCGETTNGSSIRSALAEVSVTESELKVTVLSEELRKLCNLQQLGTRNSSQTHSFIIPVQLRRGQIGARVVLQSERHQQSNRDEKLIRVVARAHVWFEQLKSAERASVEDIAAAEKLDAGDVSRALPLAFLAPSIIEAILDGKQPTDLTAERLRRIARLPHSWDEQRRVLGFTPSRH